MHSWGGPITVGPRNIPIMTSRHFSLAVLVLLPGLFMGLLAPGAARAVPVDVEIVLAADASGSVDDVEYALQRFGYANAFRNPRVIRAIRNGIHGAIAVTYVEWTGPELHITIANWTLIKDAASANRFADELQGRERVLFGGGTAVGDAILFSAAQFANNNFEGSRRVIDISGDGPTNRGHPASWARDLVAKQGITINGLPILDGFFPGLHVFYLDHVIGGPGAFAIPAKGFKDFSAAVLSKLIREIAGLKSGDDLAMGKPRDAEPGYETGAFYWTRKEPRP